MSSMTQIGTAAQHELDELEATARTHAVNAITLELERLLDPRTNVDDYGSEPRMVLWDIGNVEAQLVRIVGAFERPTESTVEALAKNGCEMSRVTTLFEMDHMDEEHWMSFVVGTVSKKRSFGVFDTKVGSIRALSLKEVFMQYGEDMLLRIGREILSPNPKSFG